MNLTTEEENTVMERYDRTDPEIQRKICLAFACKCIEEGLKVVKLKELLEECKPLIKTPLTTGRDYYEEQKIESLLSRIESAIS